MGVARRMLGTFVRLGLPILVGILATPRVEVGATLIPWAPVMADLDVYRMAGEVLLSGGDIFAAAAPGTGLTFVYPPFAAFLCVPLALLPPVVVQFGWIALCVLAMYAVLHRLGLSGWTLSLVTAGVVWFCEPVHATLGFGQLGTVLVALVVLDLVPGPRLVRALGGGRRLLPGGVLTGLASAIKLTPGLFAVMLFFAGRDHYRRAAWIVGTAAGLTAVTAVVLPSETVTFVSALAGGDTRTTEQIYYLMNQSLLGGMTRLFGPAPIVSMLGLLLCAIVALAGAYAGALWYRRGRAGLGVSICGVATLMASPISWTHHFVWVVPLAVALLDRRVSGGLRVTGWLFVGWVSAAIFSLRMPYGGDRELAYGVLERLMSATTPLLGVALVVVALAVGLVQRDIDIDGRPTVSPAAPTSAMRHSMAGGGGNQ